VVDDARQLDSVFHAKRTGADDNESIGRRTIRHDEDNRRRGTLREAIRGG
jgi:hypothetical protein